MYEMYETGHPNLIPVLLFERTEVEYGNGLLMRWRPQRDSFIQDHSFIHSFIYLFIYSHHLVVVS